MLIIIDCFLYVFLIKRGFINFRLRYGVYLKLICFKLLKIKLIIVNLIILIELCGCIDF